MLYTRLSPSSTENLYDPHISMWEHTVSVTTSLSDQVENMSQCSTLLDDGVAYGQKNVSAEHDDVTVKTTLTFEFLTIKCPQLISLSH